MTDFTYEQIIEYEDCTYDVNFEAARDWAKNHNTTFEELIDRRTPSTKEVEIREITTDGEKVVKKEVEILLRYFQIGKEPEVYIEPEDVKIERLKSGKRNFRDNLINQNQNRIDRYHNEKEANLETSDSEETFNHLLLYMQYLRDFTKLESWYLKDIQGFESWEYENYKVKEETVENLVQE